MFPGSGRQFGDVCASLGYDNGTHLDFDIVRDTPATDVVRAAVWGPYRGGRKPVHSRYRRPGTSSKHLGADLFEQAAQGQAESPEPACRDEDFAMLVERQLLLELGPEEEGTREEAAEQVEVAVLGEQRPDDPTPSVAAPGQPAVASLALPGAAVTTPPTGKRTADSFG